MKHLRIGSTSGKARAGTLILEHGKVSTPFFMPVATKGSVKLLSNEEVESTNTECLISNAFILHMKPGLEVIEKFGGLNRFMGWKKGLFTDSGGFQVLSEKFMLSLTNEGVYFRNPFTGKKMLFTPETSIKIQNSLGSDVAMCLDDVPRAGDPKKRVEEAVERTFLWAGRCKEAHSNRGQLLFGIAQGGVDRKLREKSTNQIIGLGFDGIALGGLAIGEPKKKMLEAIETSIPLLPEEKPRYLMGVGSPEDLIKAVSLGIDCFDSRMPTMNARHGTVFTESGNLNIDSSMNRLDPRPIGKNCGCFVCRDYSRAYLHHLFRTKEENALKYMSYHNLFFIQNMMNRIRESIQEGKFEKEFMGGVKR